MSDIVLGYCYAKDRMRDHLRGTFRYSPEGFEADRALIERYEVAPVTAPTETP